MVLTAVVLVVLVAELVSVVLTHNRRARVALMLWRRKRRWEREDCDRIDQDIQRQYRRHPHP